MKKIKKLAYGIYVFVWFYSFFKRLFVFRVLRKYF